MRPGAATVSGSGPANVRTAPTEETTGLGDCNDSCAKGIVIWLDFRFVLAARVGIRITAQLDQGH